VNLRNRGTPMKGLKTRTVLATLLGTLLVLLACAPSAQPAAAPAPAAPAAPAAAPAPAKAPEPKVVAEKPKRGGTLILTGDIFSEPPSLDCGRRSSAVCKTVNYVATCKLVQWNESPGRPPGSIEQVLPDLAESWESLEGGLKWVFHLRKGVMLPNGKEISSAHVVRAWERDAALESKGNVNKLRSAHTLIDAKNRIWKPNIEAPDKYTVIVKLNELDADFLSSMGGQFGLGIYFEDFMEPSKDGWGEIKNVNNIRGCGAYFPTEYVPASHMRFERNPNYYDPDLARVDKVNHRFLFEPNIIAAAFRSGQLDVLSPVQNIPTTVAEELASDKTLNVRWIPGTFYWPWLLNLEEGSPWRDVRVRRALALAVNHDAMIKDLYSGRGTTVALLAPILEFWILHPKDMGEDGKYYTKYNPQEAKRLLREAGYGNGFTFEVITSSSPSHVVAHPMHEVVFAYLEALEMGVKGKMKILDYGAWGGAPEPVGGIKMSGIIRPEIDSFVYTLIHPQFSTDRTIAGRKIPSKAKVLEGDAEFEKAVKLMDEQKRTLDVQQRLKLIHELQKVWARNLWTYYFPVPDSPVITSKRVRGYDPGASYQAGTWKYIWLAE